jgi:acyl carrier protein
VTGGEMRLIRCFRAVFGRLTVEQVRDASATTLQDWDSLHAIILIAAIEETFGVRIPTDDYPALRSYALVRDYLTAAGIL